MSENSKIVAQTHDAVIELLYNTLLSKNQFMMRIYSYNNFIEMRLDKSDLNNIVEMIQEIQKIQETS